MLRSSSFIILGLIFSFCHGYTLHGPLKSPTTVSSKSIIAPDHYFDESPNDSNFAVADFQIGRNYYQVSLRLEHWPKQTFDECTFNITTEWPIANVSATSLRLLMGNRKVVLTWYDEIYESGVHHRRRPQIVAMDFKGCRSSDLGLQNLGRDPIVQREITGGFSVYLEDPVYCKLTNGRCVIYYNEVFMTFYYPRAFDIRLDWNWSTLQIQDLHFGELLARGFDDSNTYRVMLFGLSVGPKTIMSWNNANPQIAVVASTRVLCWVENPSVVTVVNPSVVTVVNCSQFNRSGKIIYSKTTEFGVLVTPLAVRFLDNGKFFLLTGQTSCSDKSCWQLTRTIVSDNSTFGVEKFNCTGDRTSLVVSDSVWREDGSAHYWYTCKYENRYVYNENHFQL